MRAIMLALAVVASVVFLQPEVEAAVMFDGQTVGYEYYSPNNATIFFTTSKLVGSGLELPGLYSDRGPDVATVNISDTNIYVDFNTGTSGIFPAASFNGFRIYDLTNSLPAFGSVSLIGNLAAVLTFDSDNIWVDFNGLGYDGNSFVSLTVAPLAAPVPEPGSIAILGFGAIGMFVRNRRRNRTALIA